jgi:hypothetical protein
MENLENLGDEITVQKLVVYSYDEEMKKRFQESQLEETPVEE